ncbi:MAG: hypothetical protein HY682_10180 [Chloroflexi bacterium]|nr:hypothetical protein [Chloroflexota bacterium]
MARLTDRLQELGKQSPVPLGFGRPSARRRTPAMLLIGEVSVGDAAKRIEALKDNTVDAVVVRLGDARSLPEEAVSALDGLHWGVASGAASEDELGQLQEAGCDFLLIESAQAPAALLKENDLARGFPIHIALTEEEARPLEDLPFEFLVLESDRSWWPLSVNQLMRMQGTVSLVSKHIVLKVDACPPASDLPLIRDLPIDALLVDISRIAAEELDTLRKAIDELPPRKPRSEKGPSPIIPRLGMPAQEEQHEHEGDEDDDDE